jgi:amino acid permease
MFGDWKLDVVAVGDPTFAEAMNAIATVCFAFSGTPAFYPVIAEMKDPRDYNKAMGLCQIVVTLVYTIVGVVVYACCGQYVANPALGSAGPLLKRIAYGLAIPALFVTVCVRFPLQCRSPPWATGH